MSNKCDFCGKVPIVFPGFNKVSGEYHGQSKTMKICQKCQREIAIPEILAKMFKLGRKEVVALGWGRDVIYRINEPIGASQDVTP